MEAREAGRRWVGIAHKGSKEAVVALLANMSTPLPGSDWAPSGGWRAAAPRDLWAKAVQHVSEYPHLYGFGVQDLDGQSMHRGWPQGSSCTHCGQAACRLQTGNGRFSLPADAQDSHHGPLLRRL
jgi:hypothetical protein